MRKCGLKLSTVMAVALGMTGFGATSLVKADDRRAPAVAAMSIDARHEIERRVDEIANRIANSKSYFEDDDLPIHIKSSFDPVAQSLVMAIDERLGPISGFPEMEELQADITYAVWPMLEDISGFWGLDWRYGGKDMYFWFPGDRRPSERAVPQSLPGEGGFGSVMINAGHGYYYHHGYKDWRFQRAAVNGIGIIEDEITTGLAVPLFGWMNLSGIDVKLTRNASFGNHGPSGKPLYQMATRYLLEQSLPDRTDIWHSLPEDTSDLREYKEDIRSRPLYANELGVDAMISIHTNASDNAGAHGTTVIVQPGHPASAEFGTMALCYMGEQIHANEQYKDFSVAHSPIFANKGENRLAQMPAIIVELAFHTNVGDAAALKDPIFIGTAMKGLAKGYRLFSAGEICEDFELKAPTKVEGIVGDVARIRMGWAGNPEFPMTADAQLKVCDPDALCGIAHALIPEKPDEKYFDLGYRCMKEDVEKSPFSVTLAAKDFDRISAKSVNVLVSCVEPTESGPGEQGEL